ncbi:hypothetical protein F5Y01DRAFT_297461 [Xylaria sp. FL0043]|nr:hypothetical protein F5Y01DRAFT_297461 [Xylaria sp. FL0043]
MAPDQRHGSRYASSSESETPSKRPPVTTGRGRDRGTRRRSDGQFDIWFLEFSNAFNLNLPRPNSSFLSDEVGVSSYYDDSSFYRRLKTVYYEDNHDIVLRLFKKRASAIHSKWVKKPRGESDTTPSLTHLPRASTEPERISLLDSLKEVLDFVNPGETRSKRPSVGGSSTSPSPKRSRAVAAPSMPPRALSRLDSGEVRASTPLPDLHVPHGSSNSRSSQQQHVYGLIPSVNTSRSSLVSRVFTEAEDFDSRSVFPATQDTEVNLVVESSQQRLRQPSPSVVDSLAPSSSTERALVTSFEERKTFEHNVIQSSTQDVAQTSLYLDPSGGEPDLSPHDHYIAHDLRPDAAHDTIDDDLLLPRGLLDESYSTSNAPDALKFKKRLHDMWPALPPHLRNIPLAVRWEIMRVVLHCEASMEELHFQYEPKMNDQNTLWSSLQRLSCFKGRTFPEKSRPEAWRAAMSDHFRSADQVVVLSGSLALNPSKVGPLFKLSLNPLRLDLPHRLDRRFGSDRFLELIMPSPHAKEIRNLSKGNEPAIVDSILSWLAESPHFLLSRSWRSFGTKSATKKVQIDDILRPEKRTVVQERVYLFAEDGNDFRRLEATQNVSPKFEPNSEHTRMKRESLLDWLLQIQQNKKNQEQSIYKLFSRIALGLSRTQPTIIVEPGQMRHRDSDILSPSNKVMNDGIARMSTALVRKIRDVIGLDDIPAGYQGRFGSAKGFWIRDTEDTSDDIWIETYPSQRKWQCDFREEDHRTFEVRNVSRELKSANLNLQLLPILEDRAASAPIMKAEVGKFMKDSIELEIKTQKEAMKDPAQFRLWVHENAPSLRRQDRVRLGHVPWAAGLPTNREDQMELLLSQGFDPTKLEFLSSIAYGLRKQKCDELQERLNVKIGRSTYAFMVIDFRGILEAGEVHLGFSSKFTDEQSDFSETHLHGMDVLVARTPAHYPTDIQKVKAVFKPELGSLKDVIIFPSKGNIPLADMLSGGDYDGDMAWVCWEPKIVDNFINIDQPLPNIPNLFERGVLTQKKTTYESLARSCEHKDVTTAFIKEAFRFNMEPGLLGICTNYKEKLCYSRNSVRDEHAIFMSTLISHLVDRAKQGIVLTEKDWNEHRKFLNSKQGDVRRAKQSLELLTPRYKDNNWSSKDPPTHIIDYVKFVVGKPTVERELKELDEHLRDAKTWDQDLVKFVKFFERHVKSHDVRKQEEGSGKKTGDTWGKILKGLEKSIRTVAEHWTNYPEKEKFDAKVMSTYEKWKEIQPPKFSSRMMPAMLEESLSRVGLSPWDLLKASYCFKLYYRDSPKLPWFIAGYQLAFLKALVVSEGSGAFPVLMTPGVYATVRPDAKLVRAIAALNEGRCYEQASEGLEDVDTLSDQDV